MALSEPAYFYTIATVMSSESPCLTGNIRFGGFYRLDAEATRNRRMATSEH